MALNLLAQFNKLMEKLPLTPDAPAGVPGPKKKRKSSFNDNMVPRMKRDSSVSTNNFKRKRSSTFEKHLQGVLKEMMAPKNYALNYAFLEPVDPVKLGIPHYTTVIQHPMDLSTIKRKLDAHIYANYEEFESDMMLMLQNCFTFNKPEDAIYQLGKKFESLFKDLMARISKGDGDDDDENGGEDYLDEDQEIESLQREIATLSSRLAILVEKKEGKKRRKSAPTITFEMKKTISEKINDLDQEAILQVFQIIREGMPSLGVVINIFKFFDLEK